MKLACDGSLSSQRATVVSACARTHSHAAPAQSRVDVAFSSISLISAALNLNSRTRCSMSLKRLAISGDMPL